MKFKNFNFGEELQEGLNMMGFENATPIQEKTIPIIQLAQMMPIPKAPPLKPDVTGVDKILLPKPFCSLNLLPAYLYPP